jgi:hypothetical protein
MFAHDLFGVEAGIRGDVLGGYRRCHLQGIARGGSGIGSGRGGADPSGLPADAGPQPQDIAFRRHLHDLGHIRVEALGRQHRSLPEEHVKIVGGQGPASEVGEHRLLPQASLQLFARWRRVMDHGVYSGPES